MGHRWINSPKVFVPCEFKGMNTGYPITIIKKFDDGSVLGTINEDGLSSVKQVLLATEDIRI